MRRFPLRFPAALALLAALAACATPVPPHDPAHFRDEPETHALIALDVAAGGLASWAVVLQRLDGPTAGDEVIFRPSSTTSETGRTTVARAVAPGRYRAVRIMAVEDGAACGERAETRTRALYPAAVPREAATTYRLAAGDSLYAGRLGISAALLSCDGPTIDIGMTRGNASVAGRRLGVSLREGAPVLKRRSLTLRGR